MAHPDSERLALVPLFSGLSDADRSRLAEWLDVEEFGAGWRLAQEGAHGYVFFVLDEGRVRVERDGRMLAELGPGDVFGEGAFFGSGRRNATVTAETDVTLLTMFGTRFREMQSGMPEVAERLEQLVRARTEAITG